MIEGRITKECLVRMLNEVTNVFCKWILNLSRLEKEPNLVKVQEPVIIIGDIHGQFYDLVHMFEKVIDPKGLQK